MSGKVQYMENIFRYSVVVVGSWPVDVSTRLLVITTISYARSANNSNPEGL